MRDVSLSRLDVVVMSAARLSNLNFFFFPPALRLTGCSLSFSHHNNQPRTTNMSRTNSLQSLLRSSLSSTRVATRHSNVLRPSLPTTAVITATHARLLSSTRSLSDADNDSAAERKPLYCVRCKTQGHTLSQCRQPKRCYECGGEGHMASQCPRPRKCFNCGQMGHMQSECPKPRTMRRCYNCGEEGHAARDCLQPRQTPCYNCGEPGHDSRDCLVPRKCHACGEPGHEKKDCPTAANAV